MSKEELIYILKAVLKMNYKCERLLKDLQDKEEYEKVMQEYIDAKNIFEDYYKYHKENTLQYIYDNSTLFETINFEDNKYLDFMYKDLTLTISVKDDKLELSNSIEYYDKNGVFYGTYFLDKEEVDYE